MDVEKWIRREDNSIHYVYDTWYRKDQSFTHRRFEVELRHSFPRAVPPEFMGRNLVLSSEWIANTLRRVHNMEKKPRVVSNFPE